MFVSGVGNTNIDLIFSGLPRIPNEGEEIYANGFTLQMGGGTPATLINLSRLGVPTCIQTMLGQDLFSDFAREQFTQNNVTPINLYHGEQMPVTVTTAMLTPADRTFVSFCEPISITDDILEQVYQSSRGAKIVEMHTGFLEAYRELKKEGAILVFDTGWEDDLTLAKYIDYIELADYYTPNQKEAVKITNTTDPRDALRVLADYFDHVIVKLDKDGCLIQENGQTFCVPNIPEYVHRDSTGAGDAFLAGLMYGLYHDYPFRQSILFGNITGGKCVTGVGCLTASCTEEELLATSEKYQNLLRDA